jgi:2-polyprenyl-3-methyl-5-hydroxy-6-metoxy-1,4-benzoquinol methylase
MKARSSNWYQNAWSLDIKNQSWVENTGREVDFIIRTLGLTGHERILDLACGFGRHALEFARRGYSVVGIDLTPAYIEDAQKTAASEHLSAEFHCMDIRAVSYKNEFDVVLNLADGAIGYLETDAENEKIFDVIARALKPGGRHFMDVCNAAYAAKNCPVRGWEIGEKALALSYMEWDAKTHRMLFGGWDVPYGQAAAKPEIDLGDPIRLYTKEELSSLLAARGMHILSSFCNYQGEPDSARNLQLMVASVKEPG